MLLGSWFCAAQTHLDQGRAREWLETLLLSTGRLALERQRIPLQQLQFHARCLSWEIRLSGSCKTLQGRLSRSRQCLSSFTLLACRPSAANTAADSLSRAAATLPRACARANGSPGGSELGQYSSSILLPRLHRSHKILSFQVYRSSYSHTLPKPLWELHSKNSHVRRLESDTSFPGSTGSFGRDSQPVACSRFCWASREVPAGEGEGSPCWREGACCWTAQPSDGGWCHHGPAWTAVTNTITYDLLPSAVTPKEVLPPFLILISKHLLKKAPLEFHQKWLGWSSVKRMTFILIQIHIVLA